MPDPKYQEANIYVILTYVYTVLLQIYALFGVKVSVSRKITKTGLVEAFMNVFSVQNILKMFNIYIYTLVKKELFC